MMMCASGMRDLSGFKNAMASGKVPDLSTLTFEGIFGENYFHTGEEKLKDFATTYRTLRIINPLLNKKEYYLGIGMNSKYDGEGFYQQKRLRMNIMIALDVSGSMAAAGDGSMTKLEVAKEAIKLLVKQLQPSDRFGIVTYAENAQTFLPFTLRSDITDEKLAELLSEVRAGGRTNVEAGMKEAAEGFTAINVNIINNNNLEMTLENNRLIFVTDLLPTVGRSDGDQLLEYTERLVSQRIYTTYVGVGLDFNSALVEKITKTKGCSHFSINSLKEFKAMIEVEFEYLFTPIVFNATISFSSNDFSAEIVYGSPGYEKPIADQLFYLTSLFPSLTYPGFLTKGGILIVKLKPHDQIDDSNDDFIFSPISLSLQYEDRYNNVKADQFTIDHPFATPTFKYTFQEIITDIKSLKAAPEPNVDPILRDAAFYEMDENTLTETSVRKALLFIYYISLVQDYIQQINLSVTASLQSGNDGEKKREIGHRVSPREIEEISKAAVQDVFERYQPLFFLLEGVYSFEKLVFTPFHNHNNNDGGDDDNGNNNGEIKIGVKSMEQHRKDLEKYPITFNPILNLRSRALKRDPNSSIIESEFTTDLQNEIAHFRSTRQHINFRKPPSSSPPSTSSSSSTTSSGNEGGSEDKPRESKVEIIFSFDTTGSMGKSIQEAKEKIIAITKVLFAKLGSSFLRIGVIAHGDYCDPKDVIFQTFPLSDNPDVVINWIRSIKNGSGGDFPENYEQVLEYVSNAELAGWSSDASKIVVVIGDAPPHDEFECEAQMLQYQLPNPRRINWKLEVEKCYMQGIKIYSVRANDFGRNRVGYFYESLAARTCATYLPLRNFETLADLISMICYKEYSLESFTQYQYELQLQNRMDNERLVLFDLLASS